MQKLSGGAPSTDKVAPPKRSVEPIADFQGKKGKKIARKTHVPVEYVAPLHCCLWA